MIYTCTCGRQFQCNNIKSFRASRSRCKRTHFKATDLHMPEGAVTLSSSLFVIMSHNTRAARNQHEKLVRQLIQLGVPAHNISVVFGYNFKSLRIKLRHNQITHYSARFRWFPRVAALLAQSARDHKRVTAVIYLEYNSILAVPARRLVTEANKGNRKAVIKWLGYRKLLRPNLTWNHHSKPTVQGTKLIVFVKHGLEKAYNATLVNNIPKMQHWDGCLCRYLPQNVFYKAAASLVDIRMHDSVPGRCRHTTFHYPRAIHGIA